MAILLFHIISGALGLYLSALFVSGVEFTGTYKTLLLAGLILGLINFFVKPLIDKITIPLRVLTFGLFSLIINMFLVWLVADVLFPGEIEIQGIIPLFWTTLILWVLNFFLGLHRSRRKKIIALKENE